MLQASTSSQTVSASASRQQTLGNPVQYQPDSTLQTEEQPEDIVEPLKRSFDVMVSDLAETAKKEADLRADRTLLATGLATQDPFSEASKKYLDEHYEDLKQGRVNKNGKKETLSDVVLGANLLFNSTVISASEVYSRAQEAKALKSQKDSPESKFLEEAGSITISVFEGRGKHGKMVEKTVLKAVDDHIDAKLNEVLRKINRIQTLREPFGKLYQDSGNNQRLIVEIILPPNKKPIFIMKFKFELFEIERHKAYRFGPAASFLMQAPSLVRSCSRFSCIGIVCCGHITFVRSRLLRWGCRGPS